MNRSCSKEFKVIQMSSKDINSLRERFEKLDEMTPFSSDLEFSSKIANYGIYREIGTINDELARFIFNSTTGAPIRAESLKAEFIEWNGLHGLRVFSVDSTKLELRAKGFEEMAHPKLSKNTDGSLHSLFIFPEIINQIAKVQGVELVLVKSWGMNSIFGGFDPSKEYYQTNFWELENNDTLKFSNLIRQQKIAFMGTHDLIAHIAGLDSQHWPLLKQKAQQVFDTLRDYFNSVPKPSIAALILPYTAGVILDDLAQPPSYSSSHHIAVLDELLSRITKREISASFPTLLIRFPESFQKIIELSRVPEIEKNPFAIKECINSLIQEIRNSAFGVQQLSQIEKSSNI